jgi:hypothetical protein
MLYDTLLMTAVPPDPAFPTPETAIAYGALMTSGHSVVRPVPSAKVNFRVLLLEGEEGGDSLLVEAVRAEIPDADIVRTPGPIGAVALSDLYKFDLLLVATPLTEDLCHEVFESFFSHSVDAEAIIAAGGVPPDLPERMRVRVLESPENPLEFIEAIRSCRDRVLGPPNENEAPGHFVVVLSRHSPMEVIQLKCLSAATTALDFIRPRDCGGRVWFVKGEVVHAETGHLTGEAALIEMMQWPSGSIVEVEVPPCATPTIDIPWQSLLMRVAQAADEQHGVG